MSVVRKITPFFPNVDANIYRYNDTHEYDQYGEKLGSYELVDNVEAAFQPLSMQDQQREFGEALTGTWNLWVGVDVDLLHTDRIRVNGRCYEIMGNVEDWTHGLVPHKKVVLKEARK